MAERNKKRCKKNMTRTYSKMEVMRMLKPEIHDYKRSRVRSSLSRTGKNGSQTLELKVRATVASFLVTGQTVQSETERSCNFYPRNVRFTGNGGNSTTTLRCPKTESNEEFEHRRSVARDFVGPTAGRSCKDRMIVRWCRKTGGDIKQTGKCKTH